jgi:heat shock protein HslJ
MRGPRRLAGLLVVAAFATAGCGDDQGSSSESAPSSTAASASSASELDGSSYTSTAVTGHDLVPDTQIELTFSAGVLSVSAGCNLLSGQYAVEDGTLRWTSPAVSTMKACPEELMAQDTWLATLFTDGVDVTEDGSTLTLSSGEVTIELAEEPA